VTTLIFPCLEGGIGRYTPEINKKKKKYVQRAKELTNIYPIISYYCK